MEDIMKNTSFHPHLELTPPVWMHLPELWSSLQTHLGHWSAKICDVLILSMEPRITQKRDKSGTVYFSVYDPYDRSRHNFRTEQGVRIWLEERYSS
jgi:hypothetical protein